MVDLASTDGLLNKAFHLACFIQGERVAALQIVAGALAKLEVAATAQHKRLYYRPAGRPWSLRSQWDRFRNNISFSELHLLHCLIYIESEPYEIAQEQGKASALAGEEDLVIHFIKHLIMRTIKRNSFYVTLGVSRLLYNYTTAEAMDIYNAVIQDPERVKDDYYYRSRKGVLMQELKERFGDLVNICRGPHGEERFQADDNQTRFVELVRECLTFFTPWYTPCLIPAGVDPLRDGISSLSYHGHTEEDEIEMNRIHAVLHPGCFQRLIADLHFDAPDTRMGIPRFFYTNDMNNKGPHNDRHHPAQLNEEELMSIKGELDNSAARRKAGHASLLRVIVDGIERARFDLKETRSTHFRLGKEAELIEVRSLDNAGGEVLLAVHLLAHAESEKGSQPVAASITLEAGQKISIFVSPASSEKGDIVGVTYRETNPFRAASLILHQLSRSVSGGPSPRSWKGRLTLGPAVGLVLLAISFGAVIKYAWKGMGRAAKQNQVTASQQNMTINEDIRPPQRAATKDGATSTAGEAGLAGTSNTVSDRYQQSAKRPDKRVSSTTTHPIAAARPLRESTGLSPKTESTARNNAAQGPPDLTTSPEAATRTDIKTRSVAARPTSVPLSSVKKVYVETVGDEISSQNVRQMLGERLRASNQISLARNRDEADALLKISIMKSADVEPENATVVVQLINPHGNVIWPKTSSGGKYQGSAADVSASVMKDLLAAIQMSKQRR